MTFAGFRHWAGHPLWTFAATVAISPFFLWLDAWYILPLVGFIFGLVHEGYQTIFDPEHEPTLNWRDILDFSIGGWVSCLFIWLILFA